MSVRIQHPIDIPPVASFPHKAAALMQPKGAALELIACDKFHPPLGVLWTTAFGGENLQSHPFWQVIGGDLGRLRLGMPGAAQMLAPA